MLVEIRSHKIRTTKKCTRLSLAIAHMDNVGVVTSEVQAQKSLRFLLKGWEATQQIRPQQFNFLYLIQRELKKINEGGQHILQTQEQKHSPAH